MQEYENHIQDAVAEVHPSAPADLNEIKLMTGVVLKKKKFPIMLLNQVLIKFKYPPVPEYYDEERKRAVKNPSHEDYVRQKEEIDAERGLASIDVLIAFGTEIVSVPEGFSRPEDDDWINEIEAIETLGISVRRESYAARYLAWVKFKAIVDESEYGLIVNAVQSVVGVPGAEVAQAIDTFPGHAK